jgi:hypothetical protein
LQLRKRHMSCECLSAQIPKPGRSISHLNEQCGFGCGGKIIQKGKKTYVNRGYGCKGASKER